jgi:hypothetical protein
MTADPYRGSGSTSDPASWNRYSYSLNDPTNRMDPQGLATACGWVFTGEIYTYLACDSSGSGHDDMQVVNGIDQGGGGGDDSPYTPTASIIGTANQTQLVYSGLQNALRRILDNSKCSSFFDRDNGTGYGADLLNRTEYRVVPFGPDRLADGAQTNLPASVFINASSSFFNQTVYGIPGQAPFYYADFRTGLTGDDYRALLLLHELGHQTGKLGPDAVDHAANFTNTQAILDNCFTAIGGGLYK